MSMLTVQFLRALLPSSPYAVEQAKVVWVNENQQQYILEEDMKVKDHAYLYTTYIAVCGS
jgi:hypothetical protein